MTQKSRSDLNTEINANLADNTSGAITAADVRGALGDINDSGFNLLSDAPLGLALGGTGSMNLFGAANTWTAKQVFDDAINIASGSAPGSPAGGDMWFDGSHLQFSIGGTAYQLDQQSSGGTVTSASVVSANGFAGSVANASTTPAITISTSVSGLLKGNGTAVSAAVSGTDYQPAGTYVTAVSVASGNGVSASSSGGATPALSFSLGAITPSSVAASGTVTGSNISGTNTGDQTTVSGNAGTATKLQTARTIAGTSFDGSANISLANKFISQGTSDSGLSAAQFLGSLGTGIVKNTATSGVLSIAASGTDYEVPITFSTGLTRASNTVTVNTSQNISKLSNLTGNGLIKTSGGTGTLSIATSGTDYQAPITLTTTGTSGAATFSSGTLNIPNYAAGTTYTASTGLTLASGAFSVNTSQSITKLSNLTGNGFVKTSGGTGTLSIDTNTYLTTAVTSLTGTTSQVVASASTGAVTLSLPQSIATTSSPQFASMGIGIAAGAVQGLLIGGSMTGGTIGYSARASQLIQNDVTGAAFAVASNLSTVAASFTLSALHHFRVFGVSVGSGSTVTQQVGFYADSSMTLAASNYGFYGDITAGTNRWNIYMSGTAQNYLSGLTAIGGDTTVPTAVVDASASSTARASIRIRSGTAPTSPNDGDMWYDGTNLKFRVGGTTKTVI